jgi:hypothetical protein
MKATELFLLAIGCAALMPVASYAASSQQTSAASSTNEASANPTSAGRQNDHSQDTEHSASANNEKLQKQGIPDEKRTLRGSSNKTHSRSRTGITATQHPKQLSTGYKRPPGNATNLHQPGSGKAGGLATGGLIQNGAVKNAQHVRPTAVVRPNVASLNPSLNNVRHHGPNPAVVGGPASNSRNTASLNGTGMHRKP